MPGQSLYRIFYIQPMTAEEVIRETLRDWTSEFIEKRKASAIRKDFTNDGELVNSFGSNEKQGSTIGVEIFFSTYGRFMDMRSLGWSKMPPVEDIKDWIRKKGPDNFMPAYTQVRKYIPKDPERMINDMAWGIALGILKKNTFKSRRWYNKPAYRGIQILYRRLIDNLAPFTREEIKAAVSGNPPDKDTVFSRKVRPKR